MLSIEELRKLLPMEFYAKEDMEVYTEISLETLNKIMDYIIDKEQKIDKSLKAILDDWYSKNTIPIQNIGTENDLRVKLFKILGDKDK